jgi:hypothetical protein
MSTSARETSSSATPPYRGVSKLAAAGPAPEFEDKLTLFGRLVGSWDVVNVVLNEDDGTAVHESRGESHVFWISVAVAYRTSCTPLAGHRIGSDRLTVATTPRLTSGDAPG